ncbi:MAG: ABC transporter permease [Clostridiaceae bacterium]|nr:ABC transporter permease [Eubacteriales bacterium]
MRRVTKIELALLDNLVWVIVAAFFIINALWTKNFFSGQNLKNILYQSSILGLLVLGQGIVCMVGELDMSLDGVLPFAPCIIVLLWSKTGGTINPVVMLLLTLALGAGVGLINGVCVARLGMNSFLMTMAMEIMLRGFVQFAIPFSITGLPKVYSFIGKGAIGTIQAAIIAFLLIFIIFELIFRYTVFGRKFLLTGGNRRAAFISGIKTKGVIIGAFMFAGLLAAIAGLIAAGRQEAVSNTMGKDLVMMSFAGAILGGGSFEGGKGKPIGMLGGALLLGMIDNALTLQGVYVSLVYATKGMLIFAAILLDRLRVQLRDSIMRHENIRKLANADTVACSAE